MHDYLKRKLAEQKAAIVEQMRAIDRAAESESRDLTAAENEAVTKASADIDAINERARQLEDMEAAEREAERALSQLPETRGGAAGSQEQLAEQVRAFLRGESRSVQVPAESRDLVSSTVAAGGATVPTTFWGKFSESLVETSGVLEAGPTILNTTSGEPIAVPTVTSYGAAALTPQAAAIPESDPAFATRQLTAYGFKQLVQVSTELVQDTAVDLLGFLARVMGRNVGLALAPYLVTGTGTNQPQGVLTAASVGVTGGTGVGGAPDYEDLVALYHSVISPYRRSPSAGWLFRDAALAAIRVMKDGAGAYIFAPGIAGEPDTILGKPVHTDPSMPAVALGAKSVLFGDFSTYWVRIAGGVRFERSDEYAFGNDLVSFRAVLRADAQQVDQTGAIKAFQGGAS